MIPHNAENMVDVLYKEIARLNERVAELKPYEVVSGEQWKARAAADKLQEQADEIKFLNKEREQLNLRIKSLQLKLTERDEQLEACATARAADADRMRELMGTLPPIT